MFEPSQDPRLFGLPPGADFAVELLRGLRARMDGRDPEAWADIQIFVNTSRMARRLSQLFASGPAMLLPRIRLVTELGRDTLLTKLPPPADPLRRRLELTRLTAALLRQEPTLAAKSASFDLANTLATLMDEMQGEGVAPDAIAALDVSDQSGHWQRALRFLTLIQPYFNADSAPDPEARQRRVVEALIAKWALAPPDKPIILAGSTGSRGTTALLMQAVSGLPQGAVILPGFDCQMPGAIWSTLTDAFSGEDHPQYRFARLARIMDMQPDRIRPWTDTNPVPDRRALISMALRPAPVTDGWLRDGPGLGDLLEATRNLGLIEAPDPRLEALAIAIRLRAAVQAGQTAALISPDRTLTRQVTAALDRWGIEPDDSAGRPLALSAPGRLLRHVADALGKHPTPEDLLTILKHPLVHSGAGRGPHLILTHELELWLRRFGPPHPTLDDLRGWADRANIAGADRWLDWLDRTLLSAHAVANGPLDGIVARHLALTEALATGADADTTGELWLKKPGQAALHTMTELTRQADAAGDLTLADYRALLESVLNAEDVRDPVRPHPGVMIWGTLEARVQGADLVILGGLNEGVWPEAPRPDPWLNRQMRAQVGLLLPERRIGLSAHDFQQAVCAPEVLMTRALRNADAETVMSRWVNRLTNLMAGLPQTGGPHALSQMKARGQIWLDHALALESRVERTPPAPRPAPRPPASFRPKQLSVTEIQKLVRDPYAIYARRVLGLRPLDPLRKDPDAMLRGTSVHRIFERFVHDVAPHDPEAVQKLMQIAQDQMAQDVPWNATRLMWLAKMAEIAPWFVSRDSAHRATSNPAGLEVRANWAVPDTDVTLVGEADRIDRRDDGTLIVLDYKTGDAPSDKQILHFDPQVLIEAAMAEAGAFDNIPAAPVSQIGHVKMGKPYAWRLHDTRFEDPKEKKAYLDPDQAIQMLQRLLRAYADPKKGYAARRAMESMTYEYGYDHLARYGEWDISDPAQTLVLR